MQPDFAFGGILPDPRERWHNSSIRLQHSLTMFRGSKMYRADSPRGFSNIPVLSMSRSALESSALCAPSRLVLQSATSPV